MRIPLPNGSQVFVSSSVDAVKLDPLAVARSAREPLGWRIKFPNGAQILFSGYVSGMLLPVMSRNNLMAITVSIAVIGEPQRISN